jgi:transposase
MRKKSAPIRPERDRDIFRVLHAIKGMSAVDIAKKTYVSQQTIRNWRKTLSAGGTRYPQHHKAPGGGITREKSEVVQQHLYRAYGRMIAKHVPQILQPLSFALKMKHAIAHRAAKALVSGYVSYYRS